ncbi:cupredoxin domain-containing protein [Candidatus Kaiserbacteria bacterium]|nr:cupredoxin domain-containing protein [Candidatus Kaiserbacteria bacterium]
MDFITKKINVSKAVVALLLISIVIIGYVLYLNSKKEGTHSGVIKENTINLSDEGFYPQELTVSKGTTVTFTNTRDHYFWPASNLHPTHGIYSEFDPKKPISPTNSWSFTFMNVGEWEFHDHLAPYFTGIITVVDGEETLAQDRCKDNRGSTECWQKPLLKALEEDGLEASLDLLKELYSDEPDFDDNCHSVTHNIGIAAYKNFLKDKDSILTPKAAYCASGFYHGFMEAFLSVTRDVEAAREFCLYVEEKLSDKSPDAGFQCFHGIGHGLMDLAVFTSFADGVTKVDEHSLTKPALEMCEVASVREEELYRCTSAVFNSIANYYYENEYGLEADISDPLWLCREQPEKYKQSCYGNMNSTLSYVADRDFSRASSFVEKMEDTQYAPETMRYLSLTVSLSVKNEDDARKVVSVCRGLRESLQEPCLSGIAHGFLEHGTPGLEYQDAIRFCSYPIFTDKESSICLTAALSNLSVWYGEDKVNMICSNIEERYKKYCRYTYAN